MRRALILFLVLGSLTASAGEVERQWLQYQWRMLPPAERVSIPSHHVPLNDEDRAQLDLRADHLNRNLFLVTAYGQVARQLGSCLGAPVANWYHFGHWAALSSRKFLNGEAFREMDAIRRGGQETLGRLGVTPNQEELTAMLGRTNFVIGVEMLPAARKFLEMYCLGGNMPYVLFEDALGAYDRARSELVQGFRFYHQALRERNPARKATLVMVGTTFLMMGEQRRAQPCVDGVFRFGDESRGVLEALYRLLAAASAGLELADGVVIPFIHDVTAQFMPAEFAQVTIPQHRGLHLELGVPLEPQHGRFQGTGVSDWGNLQQRLAFLVAVARAHSARPQILALPRH